MNFGDKYRDFMLKPATNGIVLSVGALLAALDFLIMFFLLRFNGY